MFYYQVDNVIFLRMLDADQYLIDTGREHEELTILTNEPYLLDSSEGTA